MTWADSRVVVTGAAGFLGSHLVRRLVADGAHVVAVDNLCTGSWANLADMPGIARVEADICQWSGPTGPVDAVFNLACPASPRHYRRLPLETLRAGSVGVERMIELAVAQGAVFLQASTSEVYGEPLEHPQRESYWGNVNPVGPRSMYDESKRFAEALCAEHGRRGAAIRVARIFNTYGPDMAVGDGRVVPNFVAQARAGEPLTLYGDGRQTRCFCFVSDLVDGLIRLAASDLTGPVNLGSPDEHTVVEVADLICELVGSRSGRVFAPLPVDDPTRRCPDIGRAREGLGWTPRVPLREGLRRTLAAMDPGASGVLRD